MNELSELVKGLSSIQLRAIKQVLESGVAATAEIEPKISLAAEETNLNLKEEDSTMDEKEFLEMKDKVTSLESKVAELTDANTVLTGQAGTLQAELDELRTYKTEAEAEKALAEKKTSRKAKIEEAGLDIKIDEDPKWMEMSEDIFDFTLTTLKSFKPIAAAASTLKIPPVISPETEPDAKTIVREAFRAKRN